MRTLILLLLVALSVNGTSQSFIKTDLSSSPKQYVIDGVIFSTIVIGKATFKSKSVTITGGTNVIVSDGSGTLFNKTTANYITWSGDTAILQYPGNYAVDAALYGSGTANTDWDLLRANKRGATVTYGEAVSSFSTDGSSNFNGVGLNALIISGQVGDRVYLVLTRTGGGGDFTAKTGRFHIRKL